MFSCPFCTKTFSRRSVLDLHMASHTKEKPHKCPKCLAAFGQPGNLAQHVKSIIQGIRRVKEKNSHCTLCSYKCSNNTDLQIHFRKHSSELPFSCDIPSCEFKSKYKTYLSRHVRVIHSNQRPFECPSDGCDYKGKTREHVRSHLKIHSHEKPFACQVPGCNYTCKKKQYLSDHTSSAHSDERPFQCSTCDFRAKHASNLSRHQRTHVKVKRFQCQAQNCSFASHHNGQLKRHWIRKHSKKELMCDFPECHFQTNVLHYYDRHRKTHNEEGRRNLVCSFCFSRFRSLYDLKAHVQRHVREKPYSCSLCKYATGDCFELVNHAKRIHHIYFTSRGREDEEKNCRTCGRTCLSYSEFALHSMSHLKPVVVLERLRVHTG